MNILIDVIFFPIQPILLKGVYIYSLEVREIFCGVKMVKGFLD